MYSAGSLQTMQFVNVLINLKYEVLMSERVI